VAWQEAAACLATAATTKELVKQAVGSLVVSVLACESMVQSFFADLLLAA
jgi:hypothetical protein